MAVVTIMLMGTLMILGVSTSASSTVSRGPSTDLAAEVGNVSLDTRAGYVGREHSLLHLNRRLRLLDPYLYLDQAFPKISNKYQVLSCLSTRM